MLPAQGAVGVAGRKPQERRGFSVRTFESLKVRDYRFYFSSNFFQMACMNMQMLASGWFMYTLTGSSALLGLTMLANAIPQLVLSPFGGTIADRLPKKATILVGLVASLALALWIAVSISLDVITWHYLVISSLIQGGIMALIMPARQSFITEVVGRENLMNAVALNAATMNVTQLSAPALAGFIVAWADISGVYYLMAGLYGVAFLSLLPIRPVSRANNGMPARGRRSVLGDIKDGLVYVRNNTTLTSILLLTFFTVVFSMPFRLLLPVFTEDVLMVGPDKLGLLISVSGIGALAGSLAIASFASKRRGMLFLHTGLVTGLTILAFSVTTSYSVALVIMVIAGLAQSGRMALSNTLLQSYTEDAYLGRVMSLFMMQWGVTSLGTFGVSVLAEFIGIQPAVAMTGVLLVATSLYYYVFSPRVRSLE
jgi:MFS family permease